MKIAVFLKTKQEETPLFTRFLGLSLKVIHKLFTVAFALSVIFLMKG